MVINALTNIKFFYATYTEHLKIHDLMVQYLGRMQKEKVRELQTLNVSQRLQKLLATTPHFFQYYTISEVASFLGTEQETLTRLRSKLQNAG